jgi:hypothetical protein
VLEKALLRAIVSRTGQTGQVNQQRQLLAGCLVCLWWEVQVEGHLAICGFGGMAELEKLAAKGGNCGFGCDRHCVLALKRRMGLMAREAGGVKLVKSLEVEEK